jgi:uncharacterized protein YecE (DUF72 family)
VKRRRSNSAGDKNTLPLFHACPSAREENSGQVNDAERSTYPAGKLRRDYVANGLYLGTSAFTAAGWQGTFYPPGIKSGEQLSYYATRFQTVEVNSTLYGTPRVETVKAWYEKTPPDFIFAVKSPNVVTHEKVLVDCDAQWREFLTTMEHLREKLGPVLLQFSHFNKTIFKDEGEFLARLRPFLEKLPEDHRFAVEIRNPEWMNATFAETLREHRVALAMVDQSWMPRPWEITEKFDLITADFAYVRWLGDRKGIEAKTKQWDKTIVDRRDELTKWAELLRGLVSRDFKVYAYANNHYAGHGPGTVKLFWEIFDKK